MNKEWLEWRIKKRAEESVRPLSNRAQTVQAFVTCVGVFMGVVAYFSWSWQEGAKRRADVAAQILRSSSALEVCVMRAITTGYVPLAKASGPMRKFVSENKNNLTGCDKHLSDLQTEKVIARGVLTERELRGVGDVVWEVKDLALTFSMMERLLGEEGSEVSEENGKILNGYISEMGAVGIGDAGLAINLGHRKKMLERSFEMISPQRVVRQQC